MTVIWCMVHEIWSAMDRVFCHFGLFFSLLPEKVKILKKWKKRPCICIIILHMCIINDNHIMYSSWDMEGDGQNFLSFWTVFCPFTPPNNPKTKIFGKLKKMLGDIIILHKYTKNHEYMLYCSLDMAHTGCNCYFSFQAIFFPFTSLTTAQKIKIKNKKKMPGDIIILQ